MHFLTAPPPAGLTPMVRELWHLEDSGALHAGLPKPYVELVVSLSGIHWWRAAPAGAEHRFVDAWVTPIQARARYARSTGRRRLIGARLEPWAARAWLGPLPPGDGRPPPRLVDLIGPEARRLRSALRKAADPAQALAILSAWLGRQPALQRPVRRAPSIGSCSAADLARAMHRSDRSLRRMFAREMGVPPKQWLRLHRLDAVLRGLGRDGIAPRLAEQAVAHGYADQAHLTRDIGALTGATPRRLAARDARLPPHMLPLE